MAIVPTRTFSSASPRLVAAIVAGILLFIMIVGIVVIRFTSPATRAADNILKTIATRGSDAAWQDASADFRQAVRQPRFEAFVTEHHLGTFRSASWTRTSVSGSKAYLAGSMVLARTLARARVTLVYNGDGWHLGALAILDEAASQLP